MFQLLDARERTFRAPGDDLERFYYGFSILHCLPVGMVSEGAAGTGRVLRADTVDRYVREAGFASCEVLPIENDFYRFYYLTPRASRSSGPLKSQPRSRSLAG